MIFRTRSEEVTRSLGHVLAHVVRAGDVLLLSGDLGAGKTALVKGIAAGLAVSEPITSPTFNILLVHEGALPLYHMDLYRLDHADQLEDIDYFGTLEADGLTCVEWGDKFPEAAPDEYVSVDIAITDDTERELHVEGAGPRGAELAELWLAAAGALAGVEVSR